MINATPLQFEQQLEYFRQKVNVKSNSYLDVRGAEHDYMFTVAGANRNEIVEGFRKAVQKAIEEGTTLEEFRKDFDKIVEKTGWKYNGGRGWRTRIIYDTNLYSSYNKGRLAQHIDLQDVMPYWEYVHNDNAHPRQEHMDWDGKILSADDPWWKFHYPIKAYGCHCEVIAHSERDLQKMGRMVDSAPPVEWQDKLVGIRSGNPEIVRIPKGYDPGFEPHDFSRLWTDKHEGIDKLLFNKMVSADPMFASTAIANVLDNPGALKLLNERVGKTVRMIEDSRLPTGEIPQHILKEIPNLTYVGVIPQETLSKLVGKFDIAPQSAVIALEKSSFTHGLRGHKIDKGIDIPPEVWERLPELLRKPTAVLLQPKSMGKGKKPKDTLLFVSKEEQGKFVVQVDYEMKVENQRTGKKKKTLLNIVRTGSLIETDKNWESLNAYEILQGSLD